MADLDAIRDEFAAAFEAGEQPDVVDWLERVDESERQDLELLLDRYLMTAPRRAWDPEAFERSLAKVAVERVLESREGVSGRWPELLPLLRNRARILRQDLVRRLAESLDLGTGEAELSKVGGYYNAMEHGRLDAEGVSDRVLESLATLLESSVERLRAAGQGLSDPAGMPDEVFARLTQAEADFSVQYMAEEIPAPGGQASPPAPASPGTRDRIDELFTGG